MSGLLGLSVEKQILGFDEQGTIVGIPTAVEAICVCVFERVCSKLKLNLH